MSREPSARVPTAVIKEDEKVTISIPSYEKHSELETESGKQENIDAKNRIRVFEKPSSHPETSMLNRHVAIGSFETVYNDLENVAETSASNKQQSLEKSSNDTVSKDQSKIDQDSHEKDIKLGPSSDENQSEFSSQSIERDPTSLRSPENKLDDGKEIGQTMSACCTKHSTSPTEQPLLTENDIYRKNNETQSDDRQPSTDENSKEASVSIIADPNSQTSLYYDQKSQSGSTCLRTKLPVAMDLERSDSDANDKSRDDCSLIIEADEARKFLQAVMKPKSKGSTTNYFYGLCGLVNLGNTCYMNSALQCLSNIANLTCYALKYSFKNGNSENPFGSKDRVALAYEHLIKDMWTSGQRSVSAATLKDRMGQLASRFHGYNQQDSYEFMITLLNTLHEGLKDKSGESIISKLFYGKMQSTIICSKCKEPFIRENTMISLTVSLSNDSEDNNGYKDKHEVSNSKRLMDSLTLEDLIAATFKSGHHEKSTEWYCNNKTCETFTSAEVKLNLCTLPKILIIQLARFTLDLNSSRKIGTPVKFPVTNLDLKDYLFDPNKPNMNTLYDLIAVSNHSGSLNGGHYTAYKKDVWNNKWYYCNDNSVELIDDFKNPSQTAYVLIYEQKKNA